MLSPFLELIGALWFLAAPARPVAIRFPGALQTKSRPVSSSLPCCTGKLCLGFTQATPWTSLRIFTCVAYTKKGTLRPGTCCRKSFLFFPRIACHTLPWFLSVCVSLYTLFAYSCCIFLLPAAGCEPSRWLALMAFLTFFFFTILRTQRLPIKLFPTPPTQQQVTAYSCPLLEGCRIKWSSTEWVEEHIPIQTWITKKGSAAPGR